MHKPFEKVSCKKLIITFLFIFLLKHAYSQDFKILVFHKTNGYTHTQAIAASIKMLEELGENTDHDTWDVDATTDASAFTTNNLDQYDVIVFSNTTGGGLLNTNQQAAMEAFIQSGKGFIGIHSATDTYRNDTANASWPWYNELVGAIVQKNPYHTAANLEGTMNLLVKHPVSDHIGKIGDTWNHEEEWYYWERNGGQLSNDNTVLLEVESTGNKSYDAKRPITWLKEYDGGRSFYTALGHSGSTYENNITFRNMLEKAVLWVSNRLVIEYNCNELTTDWTDLLENGLDACWEVWMGVPHTSTGLPNARDKVTGGIPLGLNNDPTNVFSLIEVDGENQLYITGEVYGGLTTLSEYSNYHLSMEFKWGDLKWEPRLNLLRDSGILYHCKGEHGSFWKTWKSSLEFQVQETDLGDFFGLSGIGGSLPAELINGKRFFSPQSPLYSGGTVKRNQDLEKPRGEWNTLEVIVIEDKAIHYVNGVMVNALQDAKWNGNKLIDGQIQIQSEGAEVYYRNMKIKSVTNFPVEDLNTLGWEGGTTTIVTTPSCAEEAPIGNTIALKKSGGDEKWVTLDPTSLALVANGDENERELFLVEQHTNGGCVTLKSLSTNKYIQVRARSGDVIKAAGNSPGTWEDFGWVQIDENQVALKSIFSDLWIQANFNKNNTSLYPTASSSSVPEATLDFVIVDQSLSIKDTNTETLQIYPNPATNTLTITNIGNHKNAIIYDLQGKIISNIKIAAYSKNVKIDTEKLLKGVYLLALGESKKIFVKK